jgi:hypothetical protein
VRPRPGDGRRWAATAAPRRRVRGVRDLTLRPLLVAACVALNGLVLANAWLHDPTVGYDAFQHLGYAETLATGRLPTPADSNEFFSPPLPYALPAALMAAGMDPWHAVKGAQLLNVLFSIGLTWSLLRLAAVLSPGSDALKLATVCVLALFPVYFKTFALVRGEPCLAFFVVLATYLTLRLVWIADGRPAAAVTAGFAWGLALLSRQWAFLALPGLVVFMGVVAWKERPRRARVLAALAIVLTTAGLTAGWFYLRLPKEKGGITAFNLAPAAFSLRNQPASFYLGLSLDELFRDPVRPSFANQLLPTFYSDTWGDYWGFFVVVARDGRTGAFLRGAGHEVCLTAASPPAWCETNRAPMSAYLARVNMASLLPAALALAGLALGVSRLVRFLRHSTVSVEDGTLALLTLVILGSLAGYFVFLVRYTEIPRGSPIKPTYMLQVFPLLALLTARALLALRARTRAGHRVVVALLVLVFLHNLPAMVTRYVR